VEIVLNLAWALCSAGLIAYWWRYRAANTQPMRMQVFALSMAVLLLLPVISLSDDLASMQGASETDGSVRRILHENHAHLTTPAFMALPKGVTASITFPGWIRECVSLNTPSSVAMRISQALSNRPPPVLPNA